MRYSIFFLVVLCAFSGCGGGTSSSQFAKLRVIFGSATLPYGLTVIIGGTTVATTANTNSSSVPSPGQPCTPSRLTATNNSVCKIDYLTVQSGGVALTVEASGSSTNLVPSQFQSLNLSPNTQNTFVLMGPEIGYLFLDDSTPASGSVKLRIANADPSGIGTLSAWVNSNDSNTGSPTISGVTLGSASSYVIVPPGTYFVNFNVGCFSASGSVSSCVKAGPVPFAANQNLTVYVFSNQLEASAPSLAIQVPFVVADN
jgi:hypothetical protein